MTDRAAHKKNAKPKASKESKKQSRKGTAVPQAIADLLRLRDNGDLVTEISTVKQSLDWLAEHDASQLSKGCAIVEEAVSGYLDGLEDKVSANDRQSIEQALASMKALEPLADRVPVIHLAHGLLLVQWNEHWGGHRTPLSFFHSLIEDTMLPNRAARSENNQNRIAIYRSAREHLEKASLLLPHDDPRRGNALAALAETCEALEDYVSAWTAYEQASAYEEVPVEKLSEIGQKIIEQARSTALAHLDRLLAAGQLEAAEALLTRAMPKADDSEFRLRGADLLLLRGEIDKAAELYAELMR